MVNIYEDRFLPKVNKRGGIPPTPYRWDESMGECWLWTAAQRGSDMSDPYGAFRDSTRQNTAHRWCYEYHYGPVPDRLTLDHLCRVRLCVNPLHLEPVTGKENTQRKLRKLKIVCNFGHLMTAENSYARIRNGAQHFECLTCRRSSSAKSNAARRAAKLGK